MTVRLTWIEGSVKRGELQPNIRVVWGAEKALRRGVGGNAAVAICADVAVMGVSRCMPPGEGKPRLERLSAGVAAAQLAKPQGRSLGGGNGVVARHQ